ncbi:MAG TPA: pantetheine-phosphate adenylyltransferase [Bacillota bacterium]|nr:pantetheine-phosphate adenylyltransferase [Bacillota bacterium]
MDNQKIRAICPGSFDPITRGHLDIIERAAALFPQVIVGVLQNPGKNPLFSVQERVDLIKTAIKHLPNVEVVFFSGLLVDFARKVEANLIVKGLRAISDFEYEFQMALNNKRLAPEIETMFMMTKNEYSFLSSSVVREIARYGGNIRDLVTPEIEEALKVKFMLK